MDLALLVLFFAALYSIVGYASKRMFENWCNIFDRGWEFAEAMGIIMAMLWPLAWPVVIVVGIVNVFYIGVVHIAWSFRVLYEHFFQTEKGEQ